MSCHVKSEKLIICSLFSQTTLADEGVSIALKCQILVFINMQCNLYYALTDLFLFLKCPLAQRCACEKGERGPSGTTVSI